MSPVVYKYGQDVTVGDVLCSSTGSNPQMVTHFTVYDPPTGGTGRIAHGQNDVAMVVFDDHQTAVLAAVPANPNGAQHA